MYKYSSCEEVEQHDEEVEEEVEDLAKRVHLKQLLVKYVPKDKKRKVAIDPVEVEGEVTLDEVGGRIVEEDPGDDELSDAELLDLLPLPKEVLDALRFRPNVSMFIIIK